jgi:hypothetical protein
VITHDFSPLAFYLQTIHLIREGVLICGPSKQVFRLKTEG